MRLARFRTVRGRLLALLVAIAFPVAALTAITAFTTFRTVTSAIETSQTGTADEYAIRARLWYRGALRTLLAGADVLARTETATETTGAGSTRPECEAVGGRLLGQIKGFQAIAVVSRRPGATADGGCTASLVPGITPQEMTQALARMNAMPVSPLWGGAEPAEARYGHVTIAGRLYLAIAARQPEGGIYQDALLLADPALLQQVFELGHGERGMVVALESRSNGTIISRGADKLGDSWLPYTQDSQQTRDRWVGQSRSGATRAYVARMVAEPELYIVASFDDAVGRAARTQFLVLLLAPLLTLALLCLVYMRAIDKHCVSWLRGIEAAARARSGLTPAHALTADDMPTDIRSVADAFNTMVDEQEVRQRRLQTALDDNRFLVRELHHRVKNSLQVVQSYIGLTKRDYTGEARMVLADAECRVHVLSAAYRFTLADGEMQPVRVDLFIEDVITMISNLLRKRDQWVSGTIETQALLSVDRVIPLGLLIVDVMSRALRSTPTIGLRIAVSDIDDATIEIAMEADGDIAHSQPPKLFAGLVTQIEAVQVVMPEGRKLGSWRIRHRA